MIDHPQMPSRRRALQQILFFSAGLAVAPQFRSALAAPATGDERHFLMIGDFGQLKTPTQPHVADAMQQYARAKSLKPDGLFLLGDNFYGDFPGGLQCPRWQSGFEEMYPATAFPGPCWATLGNHDYDEADGIKIEAELGYAKAHPGTRWTMPAKWYRFDWPTTKPLFTCLSLDSNFKNTKRSLSPAEREAQLAWLQGELAKPRVAPWLIVQGHHPLYSNGKHGDHQHLIDEWGPLFEQHHVAFYFCGHDHDLQHLEFAGRKTSFVLSGGGGAATYDLNHPERGPFAAKVNGFTHLQVSAERFVVRHIDESGKQIHAFAKTPDGQIGAVA